MNSINPGHNRKFKSIDLNSINPVNHQKQKSLDLKNLSLPLNISAIKEEMDSNYMFYPATTILPQYEYKS